MKSAIRNIKSIKEIVYKREALMGLARNEVRGARASRQMSRVISGFMNKTPSEEKPPVPSSPTDYSNAFD